MLVMYCVIDTERIKGNMIYLFSYVLFDDSFNMIDTKTYQDVSIQLDNRKAPKRKVEELNSISIKVSSFNDIYDIFKKIVDNSLLVVFSETDINVFRSKCKELGIEYKRIAGYDLQKALYDLSDSEKHKSNLKGYCEEHNIKHNPHIPESDCIATFEVYKDLLKTYGKDFLEKYKFNK